MPVSSGDLNVVVGVLAAPLARSGKRQVDLLSNALTQRLRAGFVIDQSLIFW